MQLLRAENCAGAENGAHRGSTSASAVNTMVTIAHSRMVAVVPIGDFADAASATVRDARLRAPRSSLAA